MQTAQIQGTRKRAGKKLSDRVHKSHPGNNTIVNAEGKRVRELGKQGKTSRPVPLGFVLSSTDRRFLPEGSEA